MKELFGLQQEILIKHDLTVVDAYVAAYMLTHLDYVNKRHTKLTKGDKKQLLKDLSFLNYTDRTMRLHVSKSLSVISYYQHRKNEEEHKTFVSKKMALDVFGYDPIIMIEHNLDMKDMLLINYLTEIQYSKTMYHIMIENTRYTYLTWKLLNKDYPILKLGCAGLKRRMNELIKKGIVERKSIYDDTTKTRKNYYRVNDNVLFFNDVKV